MTTRARKIFGGLGIVAGVALVAFEVATFARSGAVERWFWLAVGVVLAVFGAAEFLAEGRGRDGT